MKAYSYALYLLSRQEYSVSKLKAKLELKAYEKEEIEETLSSLLEKGYLSERRYLENKVKALALKGKASRYILRALEQENIKLTSSDLGEIFQEKNLDEEALLRETLSKKLRGKEELLKRDFKFKEKIFRYALARGHSPQKIKKILGEFASTSDLGPDIY